MSSQLIELTGYGVVVHRPMRGATAPCRNALGPGMAEEITTAVLAEIQRGEVPLIASSVTCYTHAEGGRWASASVPARN